MTAVVAVCATVVIIGQAVAIVLIVRMLTASQEAQRSDLLNARELSDAAQAQERHALADRIQAPDRIPVIPMPNFTLPEQDDDDIGLVGQILPEVEAEVE